MSYNRVIPRDLFNEADLLKCMGQLALLLEETGDHWASFVFDADDGPFIIEQDSMDGSILVLNIKLEVRGLDIPLYRPLNSRNPWPLMFKKSSPNEEDERVFTDLGRLSAPFIKYVRDKS